VQRRLQLAEEIVMGERRRREEDGVDRQPDKREAALLVRAMTS